MTPTQETKAIVAIVLLCGVLFVLTGIWLAAQRPAPRERGCAPCMTETSTAAYTPESECREVVLRFDQMVDECQGDLRRLINELNDAIHLAAKWRTDYEACSDRVDFCLDALNDHEFILEKCRAIEKFRGGGWE